MPTIGEFKIFYYFLNFGPYLYFFLNPPWKLNIQFILHIFLIFINLDLAFFGAQ